MNDAPEARFSLAPWRVERILYDDAGLLVVDKPVGVPVHGGDEQLRHGLVERLADFLEAEGRDEYLGTHQRLDQETSGLLVFTTARERNADVAAAMEQRAIKRRYLAVVESTPKVKLRAGRVELQLETRGGRSQVVTKGGKRAVTELKVLQSEGRRQLVELSLETGRTHQIRVTLAHLGAAVVGDRLYGGAPAERLMLHACELSGGPLPRGFESPMPPAFEAALRGKRLEFPADAQAALADAACLRAPLQAQSDTFRLVNRDGDGLPGLTVDVYAGFATLNIYDAALLPRANELGQHLLGLGVRGVHLKRRVKSDLRTENARELAPGEALVGETAPEELLVDERGLALSIDLSDGLSTGLFVDQRDNHFKARSWARAGQMLNLFCYTSSFSVAAALSGSRTTSVDLSAKALNRSRRNFELNGLVPSEHRFFKEDAMKFLAKAVRRGDQYDLIVLDPPSFATVGKGTFSVKSRYGEAATACFRLLKKGGRLLAVTNHTQTTPRDLRRILSAAAEEAGRELCYAKVLSAGLDCPDGAEGPWPSKSALCEVK